MQEQMNEQQHMLLESLKESVVSHSPLPECSAGVHQGREYTVTLDPTERKNNEKKQKKVSAQRRLDNLVAAAPLAHLTASERAKLRNPDQLLVGETGYCVWCRRPFVVKRIYSKPQYYDHTCCVTEHYNYQTYLQKITVYLQTGKELTSTMLRVLEQQRIRKEMGLEQPSRIVCRIPSSEPLAICTNRNHPAYLEQVRKAKEQEKK